MRHWVVGMVLLAVAVPVLAGSLAGVTLPDTLKIGEQQLVLNGVALRTKLMIKVYVAGLYIPQKKADAAEILAEDSPRRMEMHFLRSVEAAKISEAWRDGLAGNTPAADAELKKQFETLCGFMEDMTEGSVLLLTYVPGKGTEVQVKGKSKGAIPGKAFADALLACWIGPKPGPGEKFKLGLLGS